MKCVDTLDYVECAPAFTNFSIITLFQFK